jgi:pimeloyl-ACP methyl ester carboxylesterase
VRKVVVVGSPIVGSSLSLLLKLFGRKSIAYVVHHNLWGLRYGFRLAAPFYTRDPRWTDMMDRDLSRTTLESFLFSIASLRETDLRPQLSSIRVPVMGMYGNKDNVVHPLQWQPIQEYIPSARVECFPTSGHFIMLDEPGKFQEILRDFLETPALKPDAIHS